MEKKRKKLAQSTKIVIAMVLGLIAGIIFGEKITVIKPLGTLFINLLKMCMVPVIFTSITLSVAQISDLKQFGRIGGKMFLMFIITTVIAAILGGTLAHLIKPGTSFLGSASAITEVAAKEAPSLSEILLSVVPTNPLKAMSEGALLSIVFFSVIMGISLTLIGDKKEPAVKLLESLFEAFMQLVKICLKYAPIGVFALMANLSGTNGIGVLKPLGMFFATEYLAMLIQLFIVYGLLLKIFANISIIKFINRAKDIIILAATTQSGNACIPVELEQAETHFGIPNNIAGFGMTVGTTINQDGAALNIPICVLFVAQFNGIDIPLAQLVLICAMAIIMSCGASGVPASATVFTISILASLGIPEDAFSLILASYTIIDIGLTVINVVSDIVSVVIATKMEGKLNVDVWKPGYNLAEAISNRKAEKLAQM